MIQRIQSCYLSLIFVFMLLFLRSVIWTKVDLGNVFTLKTYALVNAQGTSIIFPYGLSALLACCLILASAYAVVRHDKRSLQLRLLTIINLFLVALITLIFLWLKKLDETCLLNGSSSYKIGIIYPFIALLASLLASHHIKNDERLVRANRLR